MRWEVFLISRIVTAATLSLSLSTTGVEGFGRWERNVLLPLTTMERSETFIPSKCFI